MALTSTSPDTPARTGRRHRHDPPRRRWGIGMWLGAALVLAGVCILTWVVYTLWGTRLFTWQAQDKLRRQFVTTTTQTAPPATTAEQHLATAQAQLAALSAEVDRLREAGGPIAHLEIPRIGTSSYVVVGTTKADLQKGPGMFLDPKTGIPGTPGNALVAGHRVTYGAEFNRLDEVQPGDEIIIDTMAGRTVYRVRESFVVDAADDATIADKVIVASPDNRITLSTCNPKFSAKQRLIVVGEMVSGPFMGIPPQPHTYNDSPKPGDRGKVPGET